MQTYHLIISENQRQIIMHALDGTHSRGGFDKGSQPTTLLEELIAKIELVGPAGKINNLVE